MARQRQEGTSHNIGVYGQGVVNNSSYNSYGGYFVATYGSSRNKAIGVYATGADYAAIFDSGNVGIGTTSPDGRLAVCDGGACVYWIKEVGNYGNDTSSFLYCTDDPTDTCNGNSTNYYTCLPTDKKICTDAAASNPFDDCGKAGYSYWRYRVTCKLEGRMTEHSVDEVLSP
jgi:hypothetical protein